MASPDWRVYQARKRKHNQNGVACISQKKKYIVVSYNVVNSSLSVKGGVAQAVK